MNDSKILIDSHMLIWLLYEPEKIGTKTTDIIKAAELVYVSTISLWELALKHAKGKLTYSPLELTRGASVLGLQKLAIKDAHLLKLASIRLPHKDPFDTLLVTQSQSENTLFITVDQDILSSSYNVHDASS